MSTFKVVDGTNYVGMYEAHLKTNDDEIARLESFIKEVKRRRQDILVLLSQARLDAKKKVGAQ